MKTFPISKILFLLCSFAVGYANAQDSLVAVLSPKDVDLFLKSYAPLIKEMDALANKYETNRETVMMTMYEDNQVKNIFKKHGWDEQFFEKYAVILIGFTYYKMEKEYATLPKEQKDKVLGEMSKGIHPSDLAIVKPRFEEIEALLEEHR